MSSDRWTLSGPTLLPDGSIENCRVTVEGGLIGRIDNDRNGDIEFGDGHFIGPGLIDVQINGAFGHDFTTDPSSIPDVAAMLPSAGVTAFAPTIITAPPLSRHNADRALDEPIDGAVPIGLHLEGPAISATRRGTHPQTWIRAAADVAEDLNALRHVALVTFAPEIDGDHTLLNALTSAGITAGLGHSDASYEQATQALRAGAGLVTHLFNSMTPLHHRDPGLIGAVLDHPTATASIIADGTHVHDAMLRILWQFLDHKQRFLLVSDAMAAAGLGDGTFELGDVTVDVRNGVARNPSGSLAGSASLLLDAVVHLSRALDQPLWRVWHAASATPATLLGDDSRGRIEVGRRADLTVIRDDGICVFTVVGGQVRFGASLM